ncbi:hypothetical protein DOJK_00108 [Patescibacteria group bacterium]|nr:hypothetical protein DOJK_00108 [Patescibacteria group bacterium]
MADVNVSTDDLLTNENLDKVEEYFKLKDIIRTLRNDVKDLKLQKPEVEELDKIIKRAKEIRETIKDDESIKALSEKIETARERLDLLKELIRIDLLEKAQEEVKRNGRKLKVVSVLKEMKDGEENGKKKKPFFRN